MAATTLVMGLDQAGLAERLPKLWRVVNREKLSHRKNTAMVRKQTVE